MSKDNVAKLKTIKVIYKKPTNLTEVPGLECFKANAKLELIISCIVNQLHSKNADFITFLPYTSFLTKADSTSLQQYFPNMFIPILNNQHSFQIRAKILHSLGKDATVRSENANFNWKQYVHYYSRDEAIEKFNADTAITYLVKLNDNELYKEKYSYVKALLLHKRDRGFLALYSLFTESGMKQLSKNWQAIEGIFKYED